MCLYQLLQAFSLTSSVLMLQKICLYQNGVEFHQKVLGATAYFPTQYTELERRLQIKINTIIDIGLKHNQT